MRMSDVSDFPWPSQPENFKESMINGYNILDQIGRICMGALAHGIKVDPQKFFDG